jgi:hypothetical protein
MICHTEKRIGIEDVQKLGAEGNIWTQEEVIERWQQLHEGL